MISDEERLVNAAVIDPTAPLYSTQNPRGRPPVPGGISHPPSLCGRGYPGFSKLMHVTACCMTCGHHVAASGGLFSGYPGRIYEALDLNFREFLFHALG
jgi:hypothetical protein